MKMGDDPADSDTTIGRESSSAGRGQSAKLAAKTGVKARRFEAALREIEQIVDRLEGGELDLDDSLDQYQKGIETLKECHSLLGKAERKITLLSGFDADGNPVETPFEESEMTLDEKQASRGARRTAGRKTAGSDGDSGGGEDVSGGGLF